MVTYQGHKPSVCSKPFERMKQLAGNWEGEGDFGKGIEKVKANYRLTSANSKMIDTFYMGMPHEMFSVYQDDKNKNLIDDPLLRSGESTQIGFNGNGRK